MNLDFFKNKKLIIVVIAVISIIAIVMIVNNTFLSFLTALFLGLGFKEIIFDEILNPIIRAWCIDKGLPVKSSKETVLNDFIRDNEKVVAKIVIYMKSGKILVSEIEKLDGLELPSKPRQDMDGISLYITNINGNDVYIEDNTNMRFTISYIPHSEIEFIDYDIVKKVK